MQRTNSSRRPRNGGLLVGLLCILVVAGAIGGFAYKYYLNRQADVDSSQLITKLATRGPFDHVVSEQGEVESSSKQEVVCEIKSRGGGGIAILWVVDEGTRVKAGDKLVELDSSELELKLKEQKIQVITAKAQVTTAEAVVEQAKIARQEYLEGVFKTEEKTIMSEQAIAQQNLLKAKLAIQSSERLVAKGLVKSLQLDADKFAVSNAQNRLDTEDAKLKVLRELTKRKMLVQFDSDIEAAIASLSAARSELLEAESELALVEDQIEKCVMYAPSTGVVVHANKYSSRGGNSEFVVEPGATVRERQTILYLPNPDKMQIECKINESRITLIKVGMPARISVDAIPGLKLMGRVSKVNRYAEAGSWMSSSTKEYATQVEIINPPENIRTGMTANVQIFVEQLSDTVQIPIQGLYEHGGELFSLKQTGPDKFETVQVRLGATNDTTASIVSGLNENDRVVLNLRDHMDLMDLPVIAQEDTSHYRELNTVSATDEDESTEGPRPDGLTGHRPDRGRPGSREGQDDREGRPGGPGGRPGGPGGRAGGPGGGGAPDVETIVNMSMQRSDTDGDGKLSKEEIEKLDDRWRSGILAADTNSDGDVTRAELTAAMKKRFSGGGAR